MPPSLDTCHANTLADSTLSAFDIKIPLLFATSTIARAHVFASLVEAGGEVQDVLTVAPLRGADGIERRFTFS